MMEKYMNSPEHLLKPKSGSQIAEAIVDAIHSGKLQPGDKLYGECELARQYSESVYSVRKALQKLKDDGYLYSIPKNGVFVSSTLPGRESADFSAAGIPAEDPADYSGMTATGTVKFSTGSFLPEQQCIFQKIAESFSQASILSHLEIIPDTSRGNGKLQAGDLYEFSSHSPIYQNHPGLIDMKKYFSETVKYREYMIDDTGIPLYYTLPILFYNKEILQQLGFKDRPGFSDYDSMISYLDNVTAAVACEPEFSMPGTIQNMIYKLGKQTDDLFRDIRDFSCSTEKFMEKYYDIFLKITGYWKKYRICYPRRQQEHLNNFAAGKTPFFFGFSSSYLSLKNMNPALPCGSAVMFSHDNSVNGILAMLAVDAKSPNLLETIRAAQHFQKDEFQEEFACSGLCPMKKDLYHKMPYDNAACDFELVPSVGKEDYYIAMNIINVELWNIVLFDKNVKDAIHDILVFARSYLEMNLDHASMVKQNHWAELYQ